jgi:hypothetical protein
MTTIITRLYSDTATAQSVVDDLKANGQKAAAISLIPAGADQAAMDEAGVPSSAAAAYLGAMQPGQALVVVRAEFNPRGSARKAMIIVDRKESITVTVPNKDTYVREYPSAKYTTSVLKGAPLVMTNPFANLPHGHVMGKNLVDTGTSSSASSNGGRNSRGFWPMAPVKTPRHRASVFSGGKLMFPFAVVHR